MGLGCRDQVGGGEGGVCRFWGKHRGFGGPKNRAQSPGGVGTKCEAGRGALVVFVWKILRSGVPRTKPRGLGVSGPSDFEREIVGSGVSRTEPRSLGMPRPGGKARWWVSVDFGREIVGCGSQEQSRDAWESRGLARRGASV
eukprot:6219655-Pyramimonas_sp.AAC.1